MSGGFSLGGGKSKSDSASYGFNESAAGSSSASFGTSTQDIAFREIFQSLYGGASGAAGTALAGAPELTSTARQLFTGGTQFLQGLGDDQGTNYLTNRLSGESPVLQEQIDRLREDTGRLFKEELNPAITSRAVAGGTLGGGRQGVAQGLAADSAARVFTQGATTLRANDINARDAAAATIAGNSLQAASTGLGSLAPLLDIAERGNNASLSIFSGLSNILGGPTTLTQSRTESIADSFARSFGEQSATSRGRAWNFNTSVTGSLF